jgi:hypothetical protein
MAPAYSDHRSLTLTKSNNFDSVRARKAHGAPVPLDADQETGAGAARLV